MPNLNWTCPFCNRDATITVHSIKEETIFLGIENSEGPKAVSSQFIVCPNEKCKKFTLTIELYDADDNDGHRWETTRKLRTWTLIPSTRAKAFPPYIPKAIVDDYNEACNIRDLSPKASATLSRRSLQGAIRDFWQVKSGR